MTDTFLKAYAGKHVEKKKDPIPGRRLNLPFVPAIGSSGEIGLELEIEARNLIAPASIPQVKGATTGAVWTAHNDGSLRGEAIEYVVSQPIEIDEVEPMITGLYNALEKNSIR